MVNRMWRYNFESNANKMCEELREVFYKHVTNFNKQMKKRKKNKNVSDWEDSDDDIF